MQELGITSEKLPGIDIDAAIQGGIRDHGEVDGQTGGQGIQAYIDGSGPNSRENQEILPSTSRGNGVTIETEALNITGNKFKKNMSRDSPLT